MEQSVQYSELVTLQNNVMRIISGVPPRTNMERFYVEMSLLNVKHMYNYNIGLFMYEYVKSLLPMYFITSS